MDLINLLQNRIEGKRCSAIPVHLQVLSVLGFLSEGSFQKGVASDFNHPVCQATMSRCIDRVISAIVTMADHFIKFPNTRQEREQMRERLIFYTKLFSLIKRNCVYLQNWNKICFKLQVYKI